MKMIKMTVTREDKPSFDVYFKTIENCRAFVEFERELIENVKKKTLETKS